EPLLLRLLAALILRLTARELLLLSRARRGLALLFLLHAALLLSLLALLLGLDAALLLLDPSLLRLRALPLGIVARALALPVDAGALGCEALLFGLLAALLLSLAALLLGLLAALLVLTLLPCGHLAPELIVLPAALVPLALVLSRATFRLAPLQVVVAAVLDRIDRLAARL